jgi:hypothetical protein
MGTLVDYQFKAVLQEEYDRDAITSLFGILAGAVGLGTLVFQALASRLLFRRWGLVAGGYTQAASWAPPPWRRGRHRLARRPGGAPVRGRDRRFTLQKSVEQVSVAPYPPDTRAAALTVLSGVLKPLATAATGLVLMAAAPLLGLRGLAALTALCAIGLFLLFRRHPTLYRDRAAGGACPAQPRPVRR